MSPPAIEAVKSGELVVLPTDTVYGIGADAFNPYAVKALSDAKGRQPAVPPPVLIGSRHTLDGLVFALPKAARDLVEAFWPGALTIVVEHSPSLHGTWATPAGRSRCGCRCTRWRWRCCARPARWRWPRPTRWASRRR